MQRGAKGTAKRGKRKYERKVDVIALSPVITRNNALTPENARRDEKIGVRGFGRSRYTGGGGSSGFSPMRGYGSCKTLV